MWSRKNGNNSRMKYRAQCICVDFIVKENKQFGFVDFDAELTDYVYMKAQNWNWYFGIAQENKGKEPCQRCIAICENSHVSLGLQ